MARYALVDGTNQVLNVVEWDGKSPFNPGAGLRLVADDGTAVPVRPAQATGVDVVVGRLFKRLVTKGVITQAEADAAQA